MSLEAVSAEPIEVGALNARPPQQGRSRASYERALVAADKLMVRKNSDDFTLNEVSKVGKVSIGSIYLRFTSKDELIRAVQARVLQRIEKEQNALLDNVARHANSLDDFIFNFVFEFAELIRRHAPALSPIMYRATYDADVSSAGKRSHDAFAATVFDALLVYRDEFGRHDHLLMIQSAFRMIYATLARYLGLGSSAESSGEGDWDLLREDLSLMCVAFLRAPKLSGSGIEATRTDAQS